MCSIFIISVFGPRTPCLIFEYPNVKVRHEHFIIPLVLVYCYSCHLIAAILLFCSISEGETGSVYGSSGDKASKSPKPNSSVVSNTA